MFIKNYYSANSLKINGYYVKTITSKAFFGHKKISRKISSGIFAFTLAALKVC